MSHQSDNLHLCASCVKLLDDARLGEEGNQKLAQEWQGIGHLHDCADDLIASAVASCFICTTVLRGCVARRMRKDSYYLPSEDLELVFDNAFEKALMLARVAYAAIQARVIESQRGRALRNYSHKAPQEILQTLCDDVDFDIRTLHVSYSIRRSQNGIEVLIPAEKTSDYRFAFARFVQHEWSFTDDVALDVTQERSTSGTLGLILCKYWLDVCCNNTSSETLDWAPKRLLHLSEGVAKLVDGTNQRYATLSHRWGTRPFTTLTSKNLQTFENGLSIDDFLPSFRNAMQIVQSLKLEYLWIDSFCIMQDDPTELEEECSVMDRIYYLAVVNIGALNALSPHDGMFCQRPPRIRFARHRDKKLMIKTFNEPKGPLFERGWVFQERYLSKRMLYFGDQVWWSCSHAMCSETEISGSDVFALIHNGFHMDQEFPTWYSPFQHWYRVLELYTKTQLTYPDADKIRALQGVINRIENRVGQKSWHGHFLESKSLLWQRVDQTASRLGRAPTWSWSSMDGPLSFISCHKMSKDMATREDLLTVILSVAADSRLLCVGRLLEAKAVPEEPKGGSIVLNNGIGLMVRWDSTGLDSVAVLPVVMHALSPGWMFYLVLAPHADGCFTRVGAGSHFSFGAVQDRLWPDRPGTGRTHTVDFRSAYLEAKPQLIMIR